MWKDWDGKTFDRRILFYRDWTHEASSLEIEMDKEFFVLLKALNVSTKHIKTLLEHYEATDAAGMTQKLRSIEALSTIQAPMKKIEGGWIPDFSSRYYTEDFPYGLAIIHRLAHEKGVPSPSIDMVYDWGIKMLNRYSQ